MSDKPAFRTEGKPPHVRVFVVCSKPGCTWDVMELEHDETIKVDRPHYCNEHDPVLKEIFRK